MKGFIEVSSLSGDKMLFNVAEISYVLDNEGSSFIMPTNSVVKKKRPTDLGYCIKDSYTEVVEKIRQAIKETPPSNA